MCAAKFEKYVSRMKIHATPLPYPAVTPAGKKREDGGAVFDWY